MTEDDVIGLRTLDRLRTHLAHWPPLFLTALALAIAMAVRVALEAWLGVQFPFLPYIPAILVCALVAGWQYGGFATGVAALLAVAMRDGGMDTAFWAGIALFLISSSIIVVLAESARRARMRAEAQTLSAQESEHRFNVMADSVPLMIWVHDASGRILFVNRVWESFFGISQDAARRGGWQHVVHPDDRARYIESFQSSLLQKVPFDAAARVRRHDGQWRWVESRGVPRVGPRGELLTFAGTSIDVTERRALEVEREVLLESERAARTEAENATRAKDEFLATLSHELRTPLSVIVLWSRILARKYGGANDELKKGLALIIDNGMALSQLIGDLLDMSRIVSGRVTLDMRPIDAADLIQQAVSSHRPAADAKRITLSLDIGPNAKIVLGDSTRLQQVLWNLLANAVKFTPERGHIWVTARRDGEHLDIAVRDDGEGIAPDFLPQVFSRFRQADNSSARRHGGLGLGLAIVKQLVELHGGEVNATSRGVGMGSTFTVRLPLHESATAHEIETSGTWRRLDPDRLIMARLEGRRVLLVEDQRDMLESLRQTLEDQGAVVTAVASGLDAYAYLRASPGDFDVMLSDIGMPQMDGYELIRRVRGELSITPMVLPAVALTAYARDEDRDRALKAGFQAHVIKPYQVGQLVSLINQLIGSAAGSRDGGGTGKVRREGGTPVAS
jgi:PAS domain S-box-containing protein